MEAAVDDFFIYDIESPAAVAIQAPLKAEIYPNPANEKLEINIPQVNTAGNIGIYDLSGKQLGSVALSSTATHYELDTRMLTPGHYFIVIQTGKTIQSQQVVIKH